MPEETQRASYSPQAVDAAAKILRGSGENMLLLAGNALTERGLALAAGIAGRTGCKVMGQTYNPRMARGRGRFSIDRIPYVVEQALPVLKAFKNIILVEATIPSRSSRIRTSRACLKPEGCEVHRMTANGENSIAAL